MHLVTRAGRKSVAVLYLPHKSIGADVNFKRGGWNGREVPLDHGTMVMLTNHDSQRPFRTIEQEWRVAITGYGGPRVSQL